MTAPVRLTQSQRLILDVILADDNRAIPAWNQWDAVTDWRHNRVDPSTFRMLPLVYRRLRSIDPANPALPTLKGLYRRSWFETTRLLHLAKPSLAALIQAGYPVLLLKGAALTLRYYHDKGARFFSDVDLLVPEAQAFNALELLTHLGWRGVPSDLSERDYLERFHAVGLTHPSGGQIDLHRYLLHQNMAHGIDLPVWEHATPLDFEGLRVHSLCPADELLHSCWHGLRHGLRNNSVWFIGWIADAGIILNHAGTEIDWDHLLCEARRRQGALLLSNGLTFLAEEYGMDIPKTVLTELARGPFAWFEAAEEKRFSTPLRWMPGALYLLPFSYYRQAGRPAGLAGWFGLLRYLIYVRKVPTGWRFFPWLIKRLRKKRESVALEDGA